MFTAKDARDLTNSISNQAKPILAKLDELIKKAASDGKNFHTCYIDGTWKAYPIHITDPAPTKLQEFMIDNLLGRGFSVVLAPDPDGYSYIPPGLRNDYDGGGPSYVNRCLIIKW